MSLPVWSAAFWVRIIWFHRSPQPRWHHALDEILPAFTRIALHVLVYCVLILLFVRVMRECKQAERIYFAVLLSQALIEPLRFFLPLSAAMAVVYLQALGDVVMFFAAAQLLWTTRTTFGEHYSQPQS